MCDAVFYFLLTCSTSFQEKGGEEKGGIKIVTTLALSYVDLLATVSCANDVISVENFHYTSIPEFTIVAAPMGAVLGFVYALRRRRK